MRELTATAIASCAFLVLGASAAGSGVSPDTRVFAEAYKYHEAWDAGGAKVRDDDLADRRQALPAASAAVGGAASSGDVRGAFVQASASISSTSAATEFREDLGRAELSDTVTLSEPATVRLVGSVRITRGLTASGDARVDAWGDVVLSLRGPACPGESCYWQRWMSWIAFDGGSEPPIDEELDISVALPAGTTKLNMWVEAVASASSWSSSSFSTSAQARLELLLVVPAGVTATSGSGQLAIVGDSSGPNTPTGTGVSVAPTDPATGGTPATITFAEVTAAGETTVTSSDSGPGLPSSFQLGDPAVYYDISTTAAFVPPVTVCISYAGVSFDGEPRLLHHEGGVWVDRTTSHDAGAEVVCGTVDSLSPFVLASPVEADGMPPTISCEDPPSGWYGSNVGVACTASDEGSGLADPADASFSLVTNVPEGVETADAETASRQVCDQAGNCATAGPFGGIMVDRKAPEVRYEGNAGAYEADEWVEILCVAEDFGSGVVSDTCADAVGPAYAFDLGANMLSATATDAVGNEGSGSTSFEVVATYGSLVRLAERFVADPGVARSLAAKLEAAEAARTAAARRGVLAAFALEVEALAGRKLSDEHADVLARLARALAN